MVTLEVCDEDHSCGEVQSYLLSVIDEVEKKREPVLVTKHGKPVAKMVPLELADWVDPLGAFRFPGVITIHGDIMSPMYTDEEYEQFYQEPLERNR